MPARLLSINPATNQIIESHTQMSTREVEKKISLANSQFNKWKRTTIEYRQKLVKNLSDLLEERKNDLALLMTNEMGKIIRESVTEIEKCAWVCDYYYENAIKYLNPKESKIDGFNTKVFYKPLGIILGIMPWNFPFWQVFRFSIPTILAGNTILLKHASNVQGCSKIIEKLFYDSEFPEGVFQSLIISSDEIKKVISHQFVSAVTLTGSTEAGKSVGEIAGKYLKKTVLELGGNDPYIIFDDADIPKSVDACFEGRMLNGGQSCISAKRIIVMENVHQYFTELFVNRVKQIKMGDPTHDRTDLGTLVNRDSREILHQQVIKSINAGAECLIGGKVPPGDGAFYPPTVLIKVKPGMPAFNEELFGPVASIISVKNEEEAITLANQSQFGLGAAVFTTNKKRGRKIAEEKIDSGMCFVNDFVRSDPRLPFGGIKESGYGRELGKEGMHAFVNLKTVVEKI